MPGCSRAEGGHAHTTPHGEHNYHSVPHTIVVNKATSVECSLPCSGGWPSGLDGDGGTERPRASLIERGAVVYSAGLARCERIIPVPQPLPGASRKVQPDADANPSNPSTRVKQLCHRVSKAERQPHNKARKKYGSGRSGNCKTGISQTKDARAPAHGRSALPAARRHKAQGWGCERTQGRDAWQHHYHHPSAGTQENGAGRTPEHKLQPVLRKAELQQRTAHLLKNPRSRNSTKWNSHHISPRH